MKNFIIFKWFNEWKEIYKKDGLRVLIQKKGWSVAFVLFLFFLTKGLMWLLLPYLIAKGIF